MNISSDRKDNFQIEVAATNQTNSSNAAVHIIPDEPASPFDKIKNAKKQPKNAQGISICLGKIVLNPGISAINFYASLMHTITTFFNLTVTTSLQPLILLDPDSYNANPKKIGQILAKLILFQTLTKIFLGPGYGYLLDKFGRRPLILVAGVMSLIGYSLVIWQKTIFPGYAISKLIVANGGNILALIPLNADYIHDVSKGKCTGLTQALASFGSFLGSLYVTLMIHAGVSLSKIHLVTGFIVFFSVMFYSMGIKGGKYFLNRENDSLADVNIKPEDETFIKKLKKAMDALSRNGWLLITLVVSTLARADYYLVTIVFALYMKSYDTSPEQTPATNKRINLYQNLFFALGLVGNLFYGYILDKVHPMKVILPAMLMGLVGYILVLFAHSKDSVLIILLVISAGIAMPGLFNAANYLGIKNFPRDLRGVLSSLLNVFGVIGYLFLSVVGGYLFDKQGRYAPFMLFAIMLAVSFFVVLYIWNWLRLIEKRRKERLTKRKDIE